MGVLGPLWILGNGGVGSPLDPRERGCCVCVCVSPIPTPLSPQVNYTQPVVAVQFPNATANVDHHVECRLNAAGLRTDDERDKFAGRVAFRLRINRD
ncbi:PREDICTED: sodium/potassium-transporting ATPase subunit beta-2-like [Lepidothrix coronata]|uniref:Sodium/potassium-transporting ATPase subunit beta-2 n=1 Tax=Lepidothrix coronata TaxID=321398 RepID=A0A6J0GC35_9PASS|nr:PREDICTED: sodium/potassium-transporting ATPase subunit beta-2-like [Lepidothrix coronata]